MFKNKEILLKAVLVPFKVALNKFPSDDETPKWISKAAALATDGYLALQR